MKPLLVLVAVAAAAAGLFFVLQDDGTSKSDGPGLVQREGVATADAGTPDKTPANLQDVGEENAREEGKTNVVPTVVDQVTTDQNAAAGFGGLSGLVHDGGGQPISGVRVTLTRFGSQAFIFEEIDRSTDAMTTTDSEGRYRFERVPAYDSYALVARHDDYSEGEIPAVVIQDGSDIDAPTIVLVPGRSLRGTVTDTGGNTVGGAQLILSENVLMAGIDGGASELDAVSLKTDKFGAYEFKNLTPGKSYMIAVSAEGYGNISTPPLPILADEDTTYDMTLEVASMLAGMVTSTNGEPILGATVQAFIIDKTKPNTQSKTVSDEAGYFEITEIPPGDFQVVVRHPLFKHDARTRAKSGDMNVTIELQPLPTVTGQVVALSTGAPVPNFQVQLRRVIPGGLDNMSSADPTTLQKVSDPEGRFSIVVPGNGDYMVEALSPNFANTSSEPFTSTLGVDTPGIVVKMTEGGTLIGRVLGEGGTPLAGATIATHDKEWSDDMFWQSLGAGAPGSATEVTVTSRADGTFSAEKLTPGNYQIVVRHRDYAQEIVKGLVVTEGQESRVTDVKLPLGAEISGTVLGPSGGPLAGATVKLFPSAMQSRSYMAQTNKNGEYRIKNVREGAYKIHATRPRTSANNPFQENIDLKSTQRVLTVTNGAALAGEDFTLTDR